ncbi:hypothetical protein ACFRAR_22225 [Kitasatospora sp. NPDC056651]|uniref:hypothetical protein n=1 Tax=Kitasatospora sp. NPDC056651 TaxID=3345892 RepID=UPI003693B63D
MTVASISSVFNAVARHFDDPRAVDALCLTVCPDDQAPVFLTPTQAWDALYGPTPDLDLAASVWRAVLLAARTAHGTTEKWQLLFVWLATPRLTGTVLRICRRLRADRTDMEAEMVLSLLEGLHSDEVDSVDALLRTARTRAWNHARAGGRETACATVEGLANDRATPDQESPEVEPARPLQIEVTRYGQADCLRAEVRFTISPERVSRHALSALRGVAEQLGDPRRTWDSGRRRHLAKGHSPRGTARR